jgi:hypothetical protein
MMQRKVNAMAAKSKGPAPRSKKDIEFEKLLRHAAKLLKQAKGHTMSQRSRKRTA